MKQQYEPYYHQANTFNLLNVTILLFEGYFLKTQSIMISLLADTNQRNYRTGMEKTENNSTINIPLQ